jgi:hypothetical protein
MLRCVRTTIKIDDALLAEPKLRGADSGRTLDGVVEDALRESFAPRAVADHAARPQLPVFRGGRLVPGVDLDDSVALLEQMERAER